MNSSHDLAQALNRIAERHGSSSSASSPASFQRLRAQGRANGSPAAVAGIGPSGMSRGCLPSASPDLFYTSSRGGSPFSAGSDSGSSESEIGERTPSTKNAAHPRGWPPTNGAWASGSGAADTRHTNGASADAGPSRSRGAGPDDADTSMSGTAAIQFADEQVDLMDEDDLWGGPVSPSTSKSSPVKAPTESSAQRKKASTSKAATKSNAFQAKKAIPRRTHISSADSKDAPFWIDVPVLKPYRRKQFSIIPEILPLRSKRAAAVGANQKNRKLALDVAKPLVIEEEDEDEEEDETRSSWFDPQKRKQSQEQRKRRADPAHRGERVQERLSQRANATESDSDSDVSFEKLKVDLSQIPTVATRKWGTPEPEDASQGLRAAPKEDESPIVVSSQQAGPSAPPKKKKPVQQEQTYAYEELFAGASSSDDDSALPPAATIISAKRAQAKPSTSQPSPSIRRASPPRPAPRARPRIADDSDDDFDPVQHAKPSGSASAPSASASASANANAAARKTTGATPTATAGRASQPARAKPGPPPVPVGPNGQRIFPKADAPLPSIPLKLPQNMHPPTGMVLPREHYAKEDQKRKRRAEPTASGAKRGGAGGAGADERKRRRRTDSDGSASPERERERERRRARPSQQRAGSDSDDFEVVGTRTRNSQPQRTPPPRGGRPKARPYSGGSGRRDASYSPPRRLSGSGSARRRNQSVTPSSDEEDEDEADRRKRKGKGKAVAPPAKGPASKAAPTGRTFIMPDSQTRPRKKLKAMTLSRDKVLSKGQSHSQGDGPRASASSSRAATAGGGIDYGGPDHDSEDEAEILKRAPKSLRSELNADAWTYTSGTHTKEVFRDDLKKLAKARSQRKTGSGGGGARGGRRKSGRDDAEEDDDDETSDTYAASTGESSLSSDSRWKNRASLNDFVVDDDDEPVESLSRRVPRQLSQTQNARPSGSGSGSAKKKRSQRDESDSDRDRGGGRRSGGVGGRRQDKEREREMQPSDYIRLERSRALEQDEITMSLNDAYWWEVMWLMLHLLGQRLPPEDMRNATHARRMLARRMADGQRNLTNMVLRRNFQWYLKTYPRMLRITLSSDELAARVDRHGYGCGMCRRKNQKPESQICLFGRPYGPELFTRDKDEISSSDCDTEQSEEVKEKYYDVLPGGGGGRGRKNYVMFYLGSKCAVRAELLHQMMHWEVKALDEVRKFTKDRLEDWQGRDLGEVMKEVGSLAGEKVSKIKILCERMRTEAMDFDREGH